MNEDPTSRQRLIAAVVGQIVIMYNDDSVVSCTTSAKRSTARRCLSGPRKRSIHLVADNKLDCIHG
jgi:hypothetical protein